MTKHVLDRKRAAHESSLAKAVTHERKQLPQQASLALQRRERLRDSTKRQTAFLRVAREAHPE
jgi:hypothetical protein